MLPWFVHCGELLHELHLLYEPLLTTHGIDELNNDEITFRLDSNDSVNEPHDVLNVSDGVLRLAPINGSFVGGLPAEHACFDVLAHRL